MNTPTGKLGQYLTTAFDPRTIPGCQLWLDAADSSKITKSGSAVTSVVDKAQNITLTTAGNSSSITTVNQINNNQTLYFSNANSSSIAYLSGTLNNITTGTSFVVFQSVNQTNNYNSDYAPFFTWNSTGGLRFPAFGYVGLLTNNNVGPYTTFGGDGTPLTNVTVGSNYMFSYSWTGTTTTVTVNGGTATSGTQPSFSGSTSTVWIGRDNDSYVISYLGEVILYDSILTTSQRQSIEGYLAAKWGLTTNLPATHPYKSLPPISRQFAPVDISGCVLWIDAADATTVTLSGNNITQLQDKSSNAYVFATASGFTYNVTKFNTSYPSFYSPTSTAGYSLGSNTSFTLNQPFTAFAVGGNLITPASGGYFWDSTSNANRAALLSFSPGTPTMFAGVELFSTNTTSFTGALILTCQYNTTASSLFENGVNRSSTSNTGTNNAVSLRLGAAWSLTTNWNGHICEILFFNRLMSTAERQQVEGYLANKWGLRGNLAASHPFKLYSALTPVFTPVQISGCSLWLDALDATTVTLSSGSNVSQWNDKSGNARNFTVGSGTTTYISNSVRLNTSYMAVSNAVNLQNFTYFIVSASPIGIANQSVFGARPGTNTPDFSSLDGFGYVLENPGTSKSIIFYFIATPGSYIVDTSLPSLSNAFISTASGTSAGSYNAWVNGTSSGTASTAARTTTAAGFHIGAQWNGTSFANIISSAYIYEIIVYNTSLPTSQRQSVEGYLANKWGLVSSLPASHPYKKFIN